jgi:hypothetical protein
MEGRERASCLCMPTEELAKAYECFFGPDRSYHEARHRPPAVSLITRVA